MSGLDRRKVVLGLLLGFGTAGLAACGKKGALRPPDGEEARYIYPRPYPKPSSLVPQERQAAPEETEESISIFPDSRTRSRTY